MGAVKPGSVGKAMSTVTIVLVNNEVELKPLPLHTPGVMTFKGPKGFLYWGNAKEFNKNGWNITRDILSLDEDGYYWFKGRTEDLIIVQGENFSSSTIAEMLLKCLKEHIREVVVVGLPNVVEDCEEFVEM